MREAKHIDPNDVVNARFKFKNDSSEVIDAVGSLIINTTTK